MFPQAFADNVRGVDILLFPNVFGKAVSKFDMTKALQEVAVSTGTEIFRQDGVLVVTSYSLRVTGAQFLTRLGLSKWGVQLFGRWGSDAVLGYIRDTPLCNLAAVAPRLMQKKELEEVLALGQVGTSQAPESS